jgi:phosphate starvation-inducible PhoH-like protein
MISERIKILDPEECLALFGPYDNNLKTIHQKFTVSVVSRGNEVIISGEPEEVKQVARVLTDLLAVYRQVGRIRPEEVEYISGMVKENGASSGEWASIFTDKVEIPSIKQFIRPKNEGQKRYLEALRRYDLTFAIGPAGTGKTYLAMAAAVSALDRGLISRVILTRPAVEAGESLGFLPGDLLEKVNPYLRPLYDALHDMMEPERISRCFERDIVEVAPLAFMRGRTLNDCFVILDEAQNTTDEQMKMFLTRLGQTSRAVITGDITQIDLPPTTQSGLVAVKDILQGIDGIGFVYFSKHDVVRHRLVKDIVEAYEERDLKIRSRELKTAK